MTNAPVQFTTTPPRSPAKPGALSQWELIRLRFSKHKAAVVALYVVSALYLVAAFAEFFAPYPTGLKSLERVTQIDAEALGELFEPAVSRVTPLRPLFG